MTKDSQDRYTSCPYRASLAQLVEQLTLNQRVEGSSPSGGIRPNARSCAHKFESNTPRPSVRRVAFWGQCSRMELRNE